MKFWGDEVTVADQDATGSVGVRVNGVDMQHATYATGQTLESAGADGVSVDDVSRSNVSILRDAGMKIETDKFGMRYFLHGELSKPKYYLVPTKPKPVQRHGQFGASLEEKRHY